MFREASRDGGMREFLFTQIGNGEVRKALADVLNDPLLDDPGISQGMVKGFVALCTLTPLGREVGATEIAAELGVGTSTIHRYLRTLVLLGLIEQVPGKRRYRLALGPQSGNPA